MILGSDSAIHVMVLLAPWLWVKAVPELVKQLLSQTYDINMPEVVGIYHDRRTMLRV